MSTIGADKLGSESLASFFISAFELFLNASISNFISLERPTYFLARLGRAGAGVGGSLTVVLTTASAIFLARARVGRPVA